MSHYLAMVCGFILDFFLRDNPELPHIVRFMGSGISFSEKFFKKVCKSDIGLLLSGFIITIINILIWGFLAYLTDILVYKIHCVFGFCIECLLFFQIFAKASLRYESIKVYKKCLEKNIIEARKALSMIVGRDTCKLDFEHIIKADIETVAENMSDGIVAPWFYVTLGGIIVFATDMHFSWIILTSGIVYKVINTMDSMIGYKEGKYFYIGKAAARFDDFVNFIPARLSAVILLEVIFFYSISKKNFKIFIRSLTSFLKYRYVHSSPNAGQTESIIAGFFNIKLLGDASYFGKIVKKDSIGDGNNSVQASDILILNNIVYYSYLMLLVINLIIGGFICCIL